MLCPTELVEGFFPFTGSVGQAQLDKLERLKYRIAYFRKELT